MECKVPYVWFKNNLKLKVTDTLWNVKSFLLLHHQSLTGKVIDTSSMEGKYN